MTTSRARISVNLSKDEYKSLSDLADRHCVSMAWLGRHAIREFIERYQTEEMQLPLELVKNTGIAR